MLLTINLDTLRPYMSAVSTCAWDELLRNPKRINQVEKAAAEVMTMAGAPCIVLLTPQPETGTLHIDYQWHGDSGADDISEFLKLALIDCLTEDVSVD